MSATTDLDWGRLAELLREYAATLPPLWTVPIVRPGYTIRVTLREDPRAAAEAIRRLYR